MTSKERMTNRLLANAIFAATGDGADYETALLRIQGSNYMLRDLSRRERDIVRAWFGMPREVSETEQCA